MAAEYQHLLVELIKNQMPKFSQVLGDADIGKSGSKSAPLTSTRARFGPKAAYSSLLWHYSVQPALPH